MTYYEPIIDISRYQYPLDLPVMWAAGVRLVYIRCTVGNYYTDTRFTQFWDELRAFGFKVGVYHVNTPEYSVSSQMDRLFGPLGLNGRIPDVPICLDCELTREQNKTTITANILGCLADIEDLDGRVPSVYTRGSWWNVNVNPSNLFEKYPLWVARYANVDHPWNDAPNLKPHSFSDWVLWQWSADGNWQGSNYGVGSASVDLNKGKGATLAEVIAKLQGEPLPPPDPEPEGESQMQFINVGNDNSNIRTAPLVNTTNLIGKMPPDAVVTALDMKIGNGYVWIKFAVKPEWLLPGKTGTEGWAALVAVSGTILIDFHTATPCGEGEPMTPEQLQRLEAVEAGLQALQDLTSPFVPTNRLQTTKPGGEKLRAYPNGSEAVQLYDNDLLMDLNQTRAGQKLVAHARNGIIITGFLDPAVIGAL